MQLFATIGRVIQHNVDNVFFLGQGRTRASTDAKASLVDYQSTKIKTVVHSTTVAELYAFTRCHGTCLFLQALWMDMSSETARIHMRTDANNLVTTARTTHLPEQSETIHLITNLRREAQSGSIYDLAHVTTDNMMADVSTKHTVKMDALRTAVLTGILPKVDVHPPFRQLLKDKHKSCFFERVCQNLKQPRNIETFLGENVVDGIANFLQHLLPV